MLSSLSKTEYEEVEVGAIKRDWADGAEQTSTAAPPEMADL
jgi:hypothetical protein